jgi:O-antigen/teichoic acid export membrane protein
MTSQATTVDRKPHLRQPVRLLTGLLSPRYFLLRMSTASAAVVSGLIQTFVFARVLSPEDFSVYILIGTFGVSLWLFELGAAKILFVRQRACHLAQRVDGTVAAQSSAVVMVYAAIVLAGTLLCFAVMTSRPTVTLWQGVEFALFFSFAALNLVWSPLRNVSNAVDEFIMFETLEAIRRGGHIVIMLTLLIGLPLPAFLVLANLLWFVLLAICSARLIRKGVLTPRPPHLLSTLAGFWRSNRAEILRSGNYAVGELTIYNFPYLVVPLAFGLGAPTIILDTVFKIFRGATLIYAAGLDPLVPRQTRAFAEHDAATLKRATLAATALCAVPTLALCALLLFAGDHLFALLLGRAATVPPAVTLILVVLLLANLAQNVASCLLLHTGFFHEIARVASFLVATMAAMTVIVLVSGLDIVGFIAGYSVVYVAGAALYVAYVVRGPFRVAATPKVARR